MQFDPRTPGFVDDPYPTYARLRDADPVHWSERLGAWMVTRYDDIDAIFRDGIGEQFSSDRLRANKFKGQRGPLRSISSDPPIHTAVRGTITATLTTRVIESVRPRVAQLVDGYLDAIAAGGDTFDLITDFAYPLPITVIADLFDVPESDRDKFQDWSAAMARSMDHFFSGKGGGLSQMAAYCLELATARRDNPGDDLISAMLATDELTFEEIVGLCATLIFAGHETTTNLIGNGMLALFRNPEQLEAVRAMADDPAAVRVAIEELLRYDSPAQMLNRVVASDTELGGRFLRAGDAVLTVIGAGNRDPAAFKDPDALDVTRQPNPHLGFGVGLHYCVGAALSRREAQVAIPALVERFPRLRLAGEPKWRDTIILRGLESLPVAIV